MTKLDRLARSISDARDIADELTAREVKLSFGGQVYDPTDPMGKLVFTSLTLSYVSTEVHPCLDTQRVHD